MFDDPAGAGVAAFPLPSPGLASPIRRASWSPYLSKMKKSACRPACALLLSSSTDQGSRFRQRWSALSCSPTIAPIRVRASLESLARDLSLDIRVVEARLPPAAAHAGNARRAAMDIAEAWLVEGGERDGVILTTDADSQVAPNWIAENLAAFDAGAEAVLGRIDLDDEGKLLPEALHRRGELEDSVRATAHGIVLAARPSRTQSVASPRHDLRREPWHNSHGLLPRRASASRCPGRGQSADRLAFAPGCENSLLSDCPRDHVGSDKWARAGRCRGHPCDPKPGAGRILRRRLGAIPHGVRARLMARAVATTACCGTSRARSRLGGRTRTLGRATSMTSSKSPAFGAAWSVDRGSKPAVCAAIAETGRIAGTDRHRASFAPPPPRRRLRRATTRPDEIQHIDPRARRRRSIPFVR